VSVRLEWAGKPTNVERVSLPFQTVERINQSRSTRERDRGSLFTQQDSSDFRNLLIWGDNKLVMSSLLNECAGRIKLVYIDPPFDTGDATEGSTQSLTKSNIEGRSRFRVRVSASLKSGRRGVASKFRARDAPVHARAFSPAGAL